jgi:L-threonylcarbamoyladenylate synthase
LILTPSAENIARAADLLRHGGLVAFPTETVYGLGADARNADAVAKIFAAKGRPQDHPVIVHLAGTDQLEQWAAEVPESARALAEKFWPGPLTMVLKRAARVNDAITGGQDTIGLRIPAHPVAQQLLRAFGYGIAAPSANRFGRISPTTAAHVREEFAGKADRGRAEVVGIILDGGPSAFGIESTILDLSRGRPVLLRPGGISAAEISAVLGVEIEAAAQSGAANQPRAPGMLESHYAPSTPLSLIKNDSLQGEISQAGPAGIAVLAFGKAPPGFARKCWIEAPREASSYAHALYANLRALDAQGCARMLVETPPEDAAWAAVNDRLHRAGKQAG